MYAPEVSAANHIFTQRYMCVIPRSFMFGEKYIAKHGYGATGDPVVDRMAANNLTTMNQTIAGLCVLYSQGAEPLLKDEADCVPIYKAIVKHLNDWRDFSAQGLNPDYCPPMLDFRALEALAIYYHYKVQELAPMAQSRSQLRDSVMNMNRGGARAVQRAANPQATDEPTILPFVSIADDIERNLYGD